MDLNIETERSGSLVSDWGNLLLTALAAYVLVYLASLSSQWGSDRTSVLVQEIGHLPVLVATILLTIRASTSGQINPGSRRAWTFIGLACASWLAADSVWAFHVVTDQTYSVLSGLDLIYFAGYGFFTYGVFQFPAASLSRNARLLFWLDCGIIILGVSTLIGFLVLGQDLLQGSPGVPVNFLLLSYPIVSILALLLVFSILVRRPAAGSVGVLFLLALGLIMTAAGNIGWVYLELRGQYSGGGFAYAAWLAAKFLVAASAQRHFDISRRNLQESHPGRHARLLRLVIPYIAAATAVVVFLIAGMPEFFSRLGILLMAVTGILSITFIRQMLTLRENARLQVEQARLESEERFKALVEYSSDLITVLDHELTCRFQAPTSIEMTGYTPDEFAGTQFLDWVEAGERPRVNAVLQSVVDGTERSAKFEWHLPGPNGRVMCLESIVSNELKNPTVDGLVLNSRDITERKRLEARLRHLADHDSLTGLPNRALISERLEKALNAAPGRGIALVFIDLDHFKQVNDTLGHDAGDQVLINTAARLGSAIRTDDLLGRLSGDEFVAVLHDVAMPDDAIELGHRMLETLAPPVVISGQRVHLSASVGVVHTRSENQNAETLLSRADSAMYTAKRSGRGRVKTCQYRTTEEHQHTDLDRAPLDLRST